MVLPQICCRALVDTHVLRYLYCRQLSQLLILKSLSLRDRNLIKRKFSFYFDVLFLLVWLVCLVEEEDLFLSNNSFRKIIFTHHYFFCVFCFFFFYRLPGKAFQTVFDQHPDSLVRVVQVCDKINKRFWFLTLRKPKRVELLPWALSDKICPCLTKFCYSRTLATLKPRRKLGIVTSFSTQFDSSPLSEWRLNSSNA